MDDFFYAKQEAASPMTQPRRLQELASQYKSEKELLKLITANPNTPAKLILKLGARFPQQMLDNPILDLLLLENSSLVSEIQIQILKSLLKLQQIPEFILEGASRHKSRKELANDHTMPLRLLEILVKDPDVQVRSQVASNKNTPVELLEILATDNEAQVRSNVASHRNTSESILERLAINEEVRVRCRVAAHPKTPCKRHQNPRSG